MNFEMESLIAQSQSLMVYYLPLPHGALSRSYGTPERQWRIYHRSQGLGWDDNGRDDNGWNDRQITYGRVPAELSAWYLARVADLRWLGKGLRIWHFGSKPER